MHGLEAHASDQNCERQSLASAMLSRNTLLDDSRKLPWFA